ncbi:MAG: hypothetical protein R3F54_14415 [Alphaproteobacteria bacterium]
MADELRLGTVTDDPATPNPEPQGLAARTMASDWTLDHDQGLLVLPIGPITALTTITVDGSAVAATELFVHPWTIGRRDRECFECGSVIAISATVGWSTPQALPERLRSALMMVALDLAELHEHKIAVATESLKGISLNYARPRRDRVHQLIGRMVSPWTRPSSA